MHAAEAVRAGQERPVPEGVYRGARKEIATDYAGGEDVFIAQGSAERADEKRGEWRDEDKEKALCAGVWHGVSVAGRGRRGGDGGCGGGDSL